MGEFASGGRYIESDPIGLDGGYRDKPVHAHEQNGAAITMDDTTKSVVQLDFQLLGTALPPKEISAILGVRPDTELLRGERNEKLDLPRQNIWSLRSKSPSNDVANHWHELQTVLDAVRQPIYNIAKNGRAKITIIVKSRDRIPPITIPSSMAEFAGAINAEIDIDHLQ